MDNRPDHVIGNQVSGDIDTTLSKLQREVELLKDGLGRGIANRAQDWWDSPADMALNLGSCAAAGVALNLASRAGETWGGRWAAGARLATKALTLSLGVDVARRGVPTLGAMFDTWSTPENLDSNKDTVAKYAGSALIDYPAMLCNSPYINMAKLFNSTTLTHALIPTVVPFDAIQRPEPPLGPRIFFPRGAVMVGTDVSPSMAAMDYKEKLSSDTDNTAKEDTSLDTVARRQLIKEAAEYLERLHQMKPEPPKLEKAP